MVMPGRGSTDPVTTGKIGTLLLAEFAGLGQWRIAGVVPAVRQQDDAAHATVALTGRLQRFLQNRLEVREGLLRRWASLFAVVLALLGLGGRRDGPLEEFVELLRREFRDFVGEGDELHLETAAEIRQQLAAVLLQQAFHHLRARPAIDALQDLLVFLTAFGGQSQARVGRAGCFIVGHPFRFLVLGGGGDPLIELRVGGDVGAELQGAGELQLFDRRPTWIVDVHTGGAIDEDEDAIGRRFLALSPHSRLPEHEEEQQGKDE